jgi:hypothetical protein
MFIKTFAVFLGIPLFMKFLIFTLGLSALIIRFGPIFKSYVLLIMVLIGIIIFFILTLIWRFWRGFRSRSCFIKLFLWILLV